MLDVLIPPSVVIVGGSGPSIPTTRKSLTGWSEDGVSLSGLTLQERSSSISSQISVKTVSSDRLRQSSCTTAASGHASSRTSLEWSPADNLALKEMCDNTIVDAGRANGHSPQINGSEIVAHGRKLREELRRTKHELREKTAALKQQDRPRSRYPFTFRGESHSPEPPTEDFSFEAMLSQGPPSPTSTFADREAINDQKVALKAHVKALKEAEKLEKVKAAVQARNDKIDAQRQKAAQKAARKKAKAALTEEEWKLREKAEEAQIWGGGVHNIMSRTHFVRI